MVELIFDKIPHYNGIGVYSIKAKSGEVYIGSAYNVSRRLHQHASKLLRGEGQAELQKLIPHGLPFTAEIVCELPNSATWYDLNDAESDCIQQAKEAGNCINVSPCRKQRESDLAMLNELRRDCALYQHSKRLIEKRNKPIRTDFDNPIRMRRTEQIGFKVTKCDRERLQSVADEAGCSVRKYIILAVNEKAGRTVLTEPE